MRICPKCKEIYAFSKELYCFKCGSLTIDSIDKKSKELLEGKELTLESILDFYFDNRNKFVIDIDFSLVKLTINHNEIIINKKEKEKK